MKEKLEFNNPKTMEEGIKKYQICYHQMKHKGESTKGWLKKGQIFFSSTKNKKVVGARNAHRKLLSGPPSKN